MRFFAKCAVTACFAGLTLHAQSMLDFQSLKRDTQVFEKIVDQRLKQDFTNPFAITNDPQAAYLQGYGVVVQFHLNINRASIRTPFGEVDAPQRGAGRGVLGAKPGVDPKKAQLEKVREILVECLANYAGAIKQLNAHDRISISAHIEDRNELDPVLRKTVMVVTSTRDDIDLLAMRKLSAQEFRRKVQVLEY